MHFSCGIVRPPYEAGSCFLQVTSGCSHNKCRFCTFYKEAPFSISPEKEIREDLQCKSQYKNAGFGQNKNVGFPTFLFCLFNHHQSLAEADLLICRKDH